MIQPELLEVVRTRFARYWDGLHGVSHWARVRLNGLKLARATGARVDVVKVFSFIHDSCRLNHGYDPYHGARVAEFAETLRGSVIRLDNEGVDLLAQACILHCSGGTESDITVQVCFDEDRLEPGRVGTKPDPRYLSTPAAKDLNMIKWAYGRSLRD